MKETLPFQTESKELLNLMINSIYSNKEVFLRELISNASDAIDKYSYLSLTSQGKLPVRNGEIWIVAEPKERTIEIRDNGVGMSKDELIANLGTIARSGTKDFVAKLKEAKDKSAFDAIGQFGIGFYSAFMVAGKVSVTSHKTGDKTYEFTSDGKDSFTIEEVADQAEGTTVKVFLKPDEQDENYSRFIEANEIEDLVKKYSDFIRYPIKMMVKTSKPKLDKDGKPVEGKYDDVLEEKTLNSMSPLWKKNPKDVTDAMLNEFYKGKFHDDEDPVVSLFLNIEGLVSYNALLFIPSHAPYNLYSENYDKGLELYAKNVFIKEKCPDLVPDYLKFVKGIVNSDDFSLNVSREILQASPALKKIADSIEKKLIEKLKSLKNDDAKTYLKFYQVYGEHLKFGIYSTYGMKKDDLQDLLLFHSLNTADDAFLSLKEYVDKAAKDQKAIYYASGESLEGIRLLPEMEKYRKNGVDVLLLNQKIDEFAIMMINEYGKLPFKSISEEAKPEDLSKEEKEKTDAATAEHKRFLDDVKEALKDKVDEVAFSNKLVDSPVCISTKEGLSLEMEKTLKEQPGSDEKETPKARKILEINPDHEVFKAFSSLGEDDQAVKDFAPLLYEEAMLLEGYDIKDKGAFVKKLNELMVKALGKKEN